MVSRNRIRTISKLLTEDPDVFSKYMDAWNRGSVLELSDYHAVLGLLKKVVAKNGCSLDESKITVQLIPSGFVMKNIHINCPDSETLKKLAIRLAKQSEDPKIKHTFSHNLRINLYNSMNKDFANLVRNELNLNVKHYAMEVPADKKLNRKNLLPMVAITQAEEDISTEEELDDMDLSPSMGTDMQSQTPLGAPTAELEQPEQPQAESENILGMANQEGQEESPDSEISEIEFP